MAEIAGSGEGLTITIPPARSPVHSAVILILLIGWIWVLLANLSMIRAISHSGLSGGRDLFVVLFLAMWLFFGVNALYGLTKEVFRIEHVQVLPGVLSISKKTFGVGKEEIYSTNSVRNLRVRDLRGTYLQGWGFGSRNARITFDYEGRNVRFGEGLDDSEARRIVTLLRERAVP